MLPNIKKITYKNDGSVFSAKYMGNVTNNSHHHHHYNVGTNAAVLSTGPSRKLSFKPIPEPHGSFIGRVGYIDSAIKYLIHPVVANVQIQFPWLVIHALGGYGKTQTARKIASVCKEERKFQHFIWIDSEDDASMRNDFVAVMEQIGMDSSADSPNFDSFVHRFYDCITTCRMDEKFLIIFDNVEDFDKILKFLPLNYSALNIAVLMTSQRPFTQHSYGNANNQRLDVMLEAEAIQLVENTLGASRLDSEQDKKLLVERSGRIVLVLCVMASTIKFQRKYKSGYRIKDYLKEMGDQAICYVDKSRYLELNYEKSLQTIVRFAVSKLNATECGPIERIAVKIFDRAAYVKYTNFVPRFFAKLYLRGDICEEAKNVDMKLPMKLTDDLQIIRIAIEKLSEVSLVQVYGTRDTLGTISTSTNFFVYYLSRVFSVLNFLRVFAYGEREKQTKRKLCRPVNCADFNIFAVHRWIKASRRLELKDSGEERNILRELLFAVGDTHKWDASNSTIWEHVADYADLVNEFYVSKKTLRKFPHYNAVVLAKIIRALTPSVDFKHCSNEVDEMILDLIFASRVDAIDLIVDAFNYNVREKSTELISSAILNKKWKTVEWLINKKSCIPVEDHFRCVFQNDKETTFIPCYLEQLMEINKAMIEENLGKNPIASLYYYIHNKFRLPRTLPRIETLEITYILSALKDSDRSALCDIIEKNCGKNLLQTLLHCEPENNNSEARRRTSQFIERFEVISTMLCALNKLEHSIELDGIMERYSEKNLLECLFVCGRTHCRIGSSGIEDYDSVYMEIQEWNDVHRAAFENNTTALMDSTDPTLIESKDNYGRTPLILAVYAGRCEATTVLLEKCAANVNAMDSYDRTPLMHAIVNCHPSITKILLSHGAKAYWTTESGVSVHAMHYAVRTYVDNYRREPNEIVEAILASGDCDISATDHNGDNILHLLTGYYYATRYDPNHGALRLILPANAILVNMQNNDGLTPVQLATSLIAKFTPDHWHVKALQSFISELDRVCKNIS